MVDGKPTVISLFAGCGGSSLGYKQAGYKELLAIDFDKKAVETFRLNFPEVPCWERNIREVESQEIMDFCEIEKGELDLLDGSPPCQGFSIAGKRRVNDSRNDLFKEFVRLVRELEPKVFVMENVSGLIQGKMKGIFIEIMGELKALPYQVKCKLMNAMYYGVPQSRKRLIWVGIRNDLNLQPRFPEGKHNHLMALRKLAPDVMASRSRQRNVWKDSRFPCCTITSSCFHREIFKIPNGEREPTLTELRVLGGFPQDFQFGNGNYEAWRLIGNSVPPKMMQTIAETIKVGLIEYASA